MHVKQILFAIVWPQIWKKISNRPSLTKGCKTKQAEVQITSSSTNNR